MLCPFPTDFTDACERNFNPLFFLIKNSPSIDSDILLNALHISIISLWMFC